MAEQQGGKNIDRNERRISEKGLEGRVRRNPSNNKNEDLLTEEIKVDDASQSEEDLLKTAWSVSWKN